jgi:hypothetical protein
MKVIRPLTMKSSRSARLALLTFAAVILPLFLPIPAHAAPASETQGAVDFSGLYGQGFDFWGKVQTLTQDNVAPADMLSLLDSSFDHPEEGLGTFSIGYHGPVSDSLKNWVNQGYFGVGADALVGGVATNRILPQVQAYEVFSSHLDFGLMQRVPDRDSGWEYRWGSTLGIGQESLLQGSAVDLVGQSPNQSALFYTGLDFDLGFKNHLSDVLKERYLITLAPTLFHSDFSDSGEQYQIASDQLNVRWREENEWDLTFDTPFKPLLDFGVLALFGQQPTPIQFLPRTWDAIHNLDAWPSAGQLVGLGTRAHFYDSEGHFGLFLDGGFYGGYFGGSAALYIYGIELAAGTYGLEESAGYRIEESRIRFVSLGGSIAL